MVSFIIRRFVSAILVLFAISVTVFLIFFATPGVDPAARIAGRSASAATLAQVKAARLTADYDTRFGATSGAWTTDMFVEAIYTSLRNPPKRK